MQVGVWATQRISKRNSTGNASWGVGANTEAYEKSAYNNVQVGSTKRNWIPNFYRQCELGWDNDKEILFYRNYIFMHEFYSCIPILSTH